jgi:hypothetical protein
LIDRFEGRQESGKGVGEQDGSPKETEWFHKKAVTRRGKVSWLALSLTCRHGTPNGAMADGL